MKPSKTYNAKDTECLTLESGRINAVVKGCLSICWLSLSYVLESAQKFSQFMLVIACYVLESELTDVV